MVGYCTLICKPVFNKKNNSWDFTSVNIFHIHSLENILKTEICFGQSCLRKKKEKQYSMLTFFSIKAYLWFHIIFKTIWLIESIFFTSLFFCRKRTLKFLILQLYFSDIQYMTTISTYPSISYLNLILPKCFRFILSYLKPPVYCNCYHNMQSCFLAN